MSQQRAQGSRTSPGVCDDVVNLLFLSPLKAGSGNYTLAGRIKKHFEGSKVSFNLRGTSTFSCTSEFRDYLKENKIHVIIGLHCYHAGQWLRVVNPKQIPYAVIFGGTDLNEFSKSSENVQMMTDVVKHACELIVFCEHMAKKAHQIWPRLKRDKIQEIPQAVITTPAHRDVLAQVREKYKIDQDSKIFTLVAGIRAVKDPLYLAQSFSEWHQWQNNTVHLIVIGHVLDPVYADTFFQVVDGCPGVLYLGGMSSYETHAIIRDSFALVNTSVSEGMCTAILEAMDLKIPVLARSNPGNRALIKHKETGMLFSDPQDFIEAANFLMNNSEECKRIVEAAKMSVKLNHDEQKEKEAYMRVFDRLNSLRPSKHELEMMEEEEQRFESITASTASVDLAAVAAANNTESNPQKGSKSVRRKGSRRFLINLKKGDTIENSSTSLNNRDNQKMVTKNDCKVNEDKHHSRKSSGELKEMSLKKNDHIKKKTPSINGRGKKN